MGKYWTRYCQECNRLNKKRRRAEKSTYQKSKHCPKKHALKYWTYRQRWDKEQGKHYLTRYCRKCQSIASTEYKKFKRKLDATTS